MVGLCEGRDGRAVPQPHIREERQLPPSLITLSALRSPKLPLPFYHSRAACAAVRGGCYLRDAIRLPRVGVVLEGERILKLGQGPLHAMTALVTHATHRDVLC